ncbi:MAG: hypothetical protein AAGD11_06300 [Planctomycetota bacterium]
MNDSTIDNVDPFWQSLFEQTKSHGMDVVLAGGDNDPKLKEVLQLMHALEDGSYWQSVNPDEEM